MTYEQFEAYLQAHFATLATAPTAALSQAVMAEEEEAFDWKIARAMLASWLGLCVEAGA